MYPASKHLSAIWVQYIENMFTLFLLKEITRLSGFVICNSLLLVETYVSEPHTFTKKNRTLNNVGDNK
jgi:hypothetical protein